MKPMGFWGEFLSEGGAFWIVSVLVIFGLQQKFGSGSTFNQFAVAAVFGTVLTFIAYKN